MPSGGRHYGPPPTLGVAELVVVVLGAVEAVTGWVVVVAIGRFFGLVVVFFFGFVVVVVVFGLVVVDPRSSWDPWAT